MFWAEIRKIIYTPVNPSFTIYKWGLRGSKLYSHVFVMVVRKQLDTDKIPRACQMSSFIAKKCENMEMTIRFLFSGIFC